MTSLTIVGLRKTFGGTTALHGVDLRVRRGTVHALLGGNGSGKSTLIKCIAGVYPADEGEVTIGEYTIPAGQLTPQAARSAGLRFVHQDLALFDDLSVAENIALGTVFPAYGRSQIRWTDLHRRVRGLLDDYGIPARPQDPLGSLRAGQRTMVAVARALADQADNELVLVLDEPTAALPEKESQELIRALRARADRGQTIVLVNHRLGEIEQIADVATVLRDGRVSADVSDAAGLRATSLAGLIAQIEPSAVQQREVPPTTEPLLRVEGLTAGGVRDIDLVVRAGEIVGLAGLAGSGKSSILRALFGLLPVTSGRILLEDAPYVPASPRHALAAGVSYVPQERLTEGLLADLSVRENISVGVLGRYWRRLRMDRQAETRGATAVITRHAVRTASAETPVGRLSGGNQQKVLLGARLQRDPRLILLDEPTPGVDVRARTEIYAGIRARTAAGSGALIASTDFDELLALCDRILVVTSGAPAAELDAAALSRQDLVAAVMHS